MTMESVPARARAGTCRVCLRLDDAQVDVVLPAAVPLGQLMPWLYDLAMNNRTEPPTSAALPAARHLHLLGQPPLDPSMTAHEHAILDGTTLILASEVSGSPSAPVPDPAAAVLSARRSTASKWSPEWVRPATPLAAAALAGVAGFVAVPEEPGLPAVLLAATATGTVALVSARVIRCGRAILMTAAVVCALIVAAALGGTLFELSWSRIGIVLASTSLLLLTVAGRVSMLLSGLTAHIDHSLDPDRADTGIEAEAGLAQQVLTALVAGTSVTAALGAAVIATASGVQPQPGWAACAIVAASGAVLVQRSREHDDPTRRAALMAAGTCCTAALFVAVRHQAGQLAPWLCAMALASAIGVTWLGLGTCRPPSPRIVRRCLDGVGHLALASVLPLACWGFGLYGTARGLSLA